jgi:hypothetical protein
VQPVQTDTMRQIGHSAHSRSNRVDSAARRGRYSHILDRSICRIYVGVRRWLLVPLDVRCLLPESGVAL